MSPSSIQSLRRPAMSWSFARAFARNTALIPPAEVPDRTSITNRATTGAVAWIEEGSLGRVQSICASRRYASSDPSRFPSGRALFPPGSAGAVARTRWSSSWATPFM